MLRIGLVANELRVDNEVSGNADTVQLAPEKEDERENSSETLQQFS